MNHFNNIYYVTYQDFPANTANSSQTVATCKYLNRNGYNTILFFPIRSNKSSDDLNLIKEFYEIDSKNFFIKGLNHKTKFEKAKFFKRLFYIYGHALWSFNSLSYIIKNYDKPFLFYTRSDWVFFFLSLKKYKTVYECHQITKLRKILLKISLKNKNSKIIFLNKYLYNDSNLSQKKSNQIFIHPNGYDKDFFKNEKIHKKNKVIFTGNLLRFGNNRNLDFAIECFKDNRLKNFSLQIIGGSEKVIAEYISKYRHLNNIEFLSHIPKTKLSNYLNNAEIALLLNSNDKHSMFYTDPLKFYEYLACGLKIVAVDFPSHRELIKSENMFFFPYGNKDSFINAVIKASEKEFDESIYSLNLSIDDRVKNILSFVK